MEKLGDNISFNYRVLVDQPNKIQIENNVYLGKDVHLHIEGNKREIQLSIGKGTLIGHRCFISAADQIIIGKEVLFAPNVFITDNLHAYEDISIPITRQGLTKVKPVSIGDGTWLGINTVILPGVTIGKNCVIGANSVVNTSIPNYCVAVGSPAKIIKRYNSKTKKWS